MDSSFCPISLFGMNEFLDSDAKNITCSLLRIVLFMRQRKLEDKTVKDIMQITEFGSMVWEFLSIVYEAGWNKLTTNNNNKFFRQYISARPSQVMSHLKNCLRINKQISQESYLLSYLGQVLGTVYTRDESLQNILRDVWTCRTTLALAYVLCCLSAVWLQLQMRGKVWDRSECWFGVLPLNTRDQVQ